MTTDIRELLTGYGLWESRPEVTDFTKSLGRILPKDEVSLQVATALEQTLRAHSSNRMLLAKLCAFIQMLTKKGPTEIGVCLYSAAPDLARSVSEISKLVKAGDVLLKWPVLGDIENPDKLATLRRVPNKLKESIFTSGRFPDGTIIRDLTCSELRAAVNALMPGNSKDQAIMEAPVRKAKRELIRLANIISSISDELLAIPELALAKEQLDEWHGKLLKMLCSNPERVRETIVIRPSSDVNRAIQSQVVPL